VQQPSSSSDKAEQISFIIDITIQNSLTHKFGESFILGKLSKTHFIIQTALFVFDNEYMIKWEPFKDTLSKKNICKPLICRYFSVFVSIISGEYGIRTV
jgi:hypothetical protein